MNCDKYRDALIDGAATGGKLKGGFAEHLEVCTQCRTRLQQEQSLFEAIDDALRSKANEIPQAGFLADVHAHIWKETTPKSRWSLMWAMASAAFALALALIVVTHPWTRPPRQPAEAGVPKAPTISVQQKSELADSGRDSTKASNARANLGRQPIAGQAPHREPEVLVPPDEGQAFVQFVARLRQRDVVAQAFVIPALSTEADENKDLPQILPVEISRLQLKPLIWEKGK
jgi:negative regulator of sigma E activity